MSVRDLVEQLLDILELEADAFDEIEQAMRTDREAFVALRIGELEQRLPALLDSAEKALRLARRREQLLATLGSQLGSPRLTSSSLLPLVPADLRPRFLQVADRARRASERVRVESRVGEKLLGLSRRWRDALLGVTASPAKNDTTVYDHRARAARPKGPGGSLVRGTI